MTLQVSSSQIIKRLFEVPNGPIFICESSGVENILPAGSVNPTLLEKLRQKDYPETLDFECSTFLDVVIFLFVHLWKGKELVWAENSLGAIPSGESVENNQPNIVYVSNAEVFSFAQLPEYNWILREKEHSPGPEPMSFDASVEVEYQKPKYSVFLDTVLPAIAQRRLIHFKKLSR